MNRLPSNEFRKTYHRLLEPTAVTALGHVIGYYMPVATIESIVDGATEAIAEAQASGPGSLKRVMDLTYDAIADGRKVQQAERDRILRAVNKG